jgi:hypothetical protein
MSDEGEKLKKVGAGRLRPFFVREKMSCIRSLCQYIREQLIPSCKE